MALYCYRMLAETHASFYGYMNTPKEEVVTALTDTNSEGGKLANTIDFAPFTMRHYHRRKKKPIMLRFSENHSPSRYKLSPPLLPSAWSRQTGQPVG